MKSPAEIQHAFHRLQDALGLSIVCGQIVLNVNNGDLAAVEKIREFTRVASAKPVDKQDRRVQT